MSDMQAMMCLLAPSTVFTLAMISTRLQVLSTMHSLMFWLELIRRKISFLRSMLEKESFSRTDISVFLCVKLTLA